MDSAVKIVDGQIVEISAEFLGAVTPLNPFLRTDSGPRLAMMAGHMSQALLPIGGDERRIFTGEESKYSKYVFNVDMPATGQILTSIERLPSARFKLNPELTVLFEDLDQRRQGKHVLDVVNLTTHWLMHQTYGYKFDFLKHNIAQIRPNNIIEKGTVFCNPPDVKPNGNLAFGINTIVAYLTVHQIIEDGFVARRGWLEKAAVTAMGSRQCSWGKSKYALNIYGDATNYKPFPEPGEKIRDDGILFALRPYTKYLGVCDMTADALMTPDPVFDDLVFGEPGAEVIDLTVFHDHSQPRPPTPYGMSDLCEKYLAAQEAYSRKLYRAYRDRIRVNPKLTLSRRLHQQLVQAIDCDPSMIGQPTTTAHTYRATPLDDWTVEVKYAYKHIPTVGAKITGLHGNKGIIVDVLEDEDMPTDRWGVVADVIMDPDSVGKRMNDGCFYEHYLTASMDQVSRYIRDLYRMGDVEKAYSELIRYYSCVSSPMRIRTEETCLTAERRKEHVEAVVRDGIYLYLPCGTVEIGAQQVRNIRKHFPLLRGPVRYRAATGEFVDTVDDVILGSMYVIILEKTAKDWAASSSLKHQHHGVPAKLTQRDRNSMVWRDQPNRSLGEAEVRLINAMIDRLIVSEMLEIPNSPQAQRHIARALLTAPKPTAIDTIIDRNVVMRGMSRALQFVKHILECMGIWFKRDKEW